MNVDFTGFARAVNAIGCVYVDVDHRYFHQNGPYSSSSDYAEINLQPGYQALCGFDALSFVRYRHTDNDIVRAARQQAFLREARAKVPPERLIEDRKKLIKIFTTYTTLRHRRRPIQMLQVLKLFFDLRGRADQGDPLRGPPRPLLRHRLPPGDPDGGEPVPRQREHARVRRDRPRSRTRR